MAKVEVSTPTGTLSIVLLVYCAINAVGIARLY